MTDQRRENFAKRFMRKFRRDNRGHATILLAFGMPMVIGSGGMAVDFAQLYMWKRELQYAADQAAIAAAWELSDHMNSDYFVDRGLQEFNNNEEITKTFNTTPVIKRSNYAGKVGNAVTVTVSATQLLPFMSYFTGKTSTINIRSQAAFTGGATTSQCLIATEDSDGGAVKLNGDSLFTAGCGIAALSSSEKLCVEWNADDTCAKWEGEDAIVVNGQPTIDAGTIAAVGTIDDQLNDITDDIIIENAENLSDPFEGLEPPIDKVHGEGQYKCRATGRDKDVVLGVATPGWYDGIKVGCDTKFEPGIYVIDGGMLQLSGNYTTTGTDIMFILINGAGFRLNGTSNAGVSKEINLQGITEARLINDYGVDPVAANKMDGMLVFEDPDSEGNNPTGEGLGNLFAGTNNTWISGSVYLPSSTLSLAGTAKVANRCLTIVANKVILTGTTDMTDFCPAGQSHDTTVIYGTVRLVA